ncbi:hypothetical protein [Pseudoclavibacter sp. CFCC 14310]|uniref:hypothetical protein n=1 Tax=Pseudoclavibacter sp. CFCC 14310 TaxID=2615180 RepID=UPI001787A0B0|nr:hypothetical protein [Pseudoclavibacter sp. CFCC 14310]
MGIQDWETIAKTVGVAWPVLVGIRAIFRDKGNRLAKKLGQHSALFRDIPPNSAAANRLQELLDLEAQQLAEVESKRLSRTFNWANFTLALVLSGIISLCSWGLLTWALSAQEGWLAVLAWFCTGTGIFVGVVVVAAGWSTLYQPTKKKNK